nr:hypothetical protein Q903MT_gene5251 [Picea sitchensis]
MFGMSPSLLSPSIEDLLIAFITLFQNLSELPDYSKFYSSHCGQRELMRILGDDALINSL